MEKLAGDLFGIKVYLAIMSYSWYGISILLTLVHTYRKIPLIALGWYNFVRGFEGAYNRGAYNRGAYIQGVISGGAYNRGGIIKVGFCCILLSSFGEEQVFNQNVEIFPLHSVSVQVWRNFDLTTRKESYKESPEKILRLQRDSNPWPPRYRCDALPTELRSLDGSKSYDLYHINFTTRKELIGSFQPEVNLANLATERAKFPHPLSLGNCGSEMG